MQMRRVTMSVTGATRVVMAIAMGNMASSTRVWGVLGVMWHQEQAMGAAGDGAKVSSHNHTTQGISTERNLKGLFGVLVHSC